jgi:hypothetical protein
VTITDTTRRALRLVDNAGPDGIEAAWFGRTFWAGTRTAIRTYNCGYGASVGASHVLPRMGGAYLTRLFRMGLVSRDTFTSGGGWWHTTYRLTDAGRAAIA